MDKLIPIFDEPTNNVKITRIPHTEAEAAVRESLSVKSRSRGFLFPEMLTIISEDSTI